jgi:LysR family hydrogen peroxide-inducible transcriptional activator
VVALEADVGDVAHETLSIDRFVLITRLDHPLAATRSPVTEAELRGEELLLLTEGHCFREQALEACRSARIKEGEFRATSLSTLVQMVSGGVGITVIPEIAVDTEARRARLHVRLLGRPAAFRTIALIWRKGSALEPTLQAVASALRAAYPAATESRTRSRRPAL